MILEILQYPDARLTKVAKPVKSISKKVRNTALAMLKTMYHHKGIGLASIQVGYIKRVIVLDTSPDKDNPLIMINPVILSHQDKVSSEEGCLSVYKNRKPVIRDKTISVKHTTLDGDTITNTYSGLTSICIQHEIDHLNGILFIDRFKEQNQA